VVNRKQVLLQIGKSVAIARKLRCYTQTELGERAEISRQMIAAIESGKPSKHLIDVIWALGLESQLVQALSPQNDTFGLGLAVNNLPRYVKGKQRKGDSDEF
jgi:transcriptional regulator with XRE-family HTH domain